MKVQIKMVISHDNHQQTTHDILCLERQELSIETLGLTLKESKALAAKVQSTLVFEQVKEYADIFRLCTCCGKSRRIKDYYPITCRSLFGKINLKCPRVIECSCQSHASSTISLLSKVLIGRITPELLYLESKWASLMSWGYSISFRRSFTHKDQCFDGL